MPFFKPKYFTLKYYESLGLPKRLAKFYLIVFIVGFAVGCYFFIYYFIYQSKPSNNLGDDKINLNKSNKVEIHHNKIDQINMGNTENNNYYDTIGKD